MDFPKGFLIKEKIITKKILVFRKGSIGGVNVSKFIFKNKKNSIKKRYSINKNTFVFLF